MLCRHSETSLCIEESLHEHELVTTAAEVYQQIQQDLIDALTKKEPE